MAHAVPIPRKNLPQGELKDFGAGCGYRVDMYGESLRPWAMADHQQQCEKINNYGILQFRTSKLCILSTRLLADQQNSSS